MDRSTECVSPTGGSSRHKNLGLLAASSGWTDSAKMVDVIDFWWIHFYKLLPRSREINELPLLPNAGLLLPKMLPRAWMHDFVVKTYPSSTHWFEIEKDGAQGRNRTTDTRIFRPVSILIQAASELLLGAHSESLGRFGTVLHINPPAEAEVKS